MLSGGVAALAQARGHGLERQLGGLDVWHLVPLERTGHARVGDGADGVGGGDGAVAGVLVVVDEHALAFLLPPAAGGAAGHAPLDLARERERGAADFFEALVWLDAHVDVHAARAGGLGEAAQAVLVEHVAHAERNLAHLREGHAGAGVEVDAQLVGMVEVAAAHGPGVPVDHAEVDAPDEVRGVVGTSSRAWRPLGKVTVAVCSHSGALSGTRFWKNGSPPTPSTQRLSTVGRSRRWRTTAVCALEVVVDEIDLGQTDVGEERLVGIADAHLAPAHLHDDRLTFRGGHCWKDARS